MGSASAHIISRGTRSSPQLQSAVGRTPELRIDALKGVPGAPGEQRFMVGNGSVFFFTARLKIHCEFYLHFPPNTERRLPGLTLKTHAYDSV